MNKPQPIFQLIGHKEDLLHLAEDLARKPEIGVDLEADSMFHYQERVCLIQISTSSQNIIIDPLALNDLSPLAPIFSNPRIRKIFHGADYDIRSLYRDFQLEVKTLFDTQIAASFLGIHETGLAALLKNLLGVDLDKKYQRKDWSQRPLPPDMLAYAAHDTCHLLELRAILEKRLRQKKRLAWVQEECERLSRVRPAPPDDNPLFMRFKNARILAPTGLAVLESLLKFRDEMASRRDRPPFKILSNDAIMDLALVKPVSLEGLQGIRGLSARQIATMGRAILKMVSESLTQPEQQLPTWPKKTRTRILPEVSKKVKVLKSWREQRAGEMGIDPSLLCTNAQLESLARAFPQTTKDLEKVDTLRNWQKKLYGQEILAVLNPSHPTSSARN